MGAVIHSYGVLGVGREGSGDWQAYGTKPGEVGLMSGDARAPPSR